MHAAVLKKLCILWTAFLSKIYALSRVSLSEFDSQSYLGNILSVQIDEGSYQSVSYSLVSTKGEL